MKKPIISIAVMILTVMVLVGCGQEPIDSTSTALTPVISTPLSPTDNSTIDDAPEVLQNGIPLKVIEPTDEAEINTDTIAVKGQTLPGAAVSVNEAVSITDSEGNFTITISLEPGPNAIDVIATDDSGKQGEVLILVNVIS